MKKIIPLIVVLLFSPSLYAYEVKVMEFRSAKSTPASDPDSFSTDLKPPQSAIVEKTFMTFMCSAKLSVMKFGKDQEGNVILTENRDLERNKILGKLGAKEERFNSSNYGFINFDFKVQSKALKFDLSLFGPNDEDPATDKSLFITLSYHKSFEGKGELRRVTAKEVNHIELDGDKNLPGGFKLRVSLGEKIFKGNAASLIVHCTDPKKEIRPVEVFID
jgi:hypothetical protein